MGQLHSNGTKDSGEDRSVANCVLEGLVRLGREAFLAPAPRISLPAALVPFPTQRDVSGCRDLSSFCSLGRVQGWSQVP